MKKIFLILIIFGSALFLSSCGQTTTSQEKITNNTVTKTGTFTVKSGEEYLLSTPEGVISTTSTKIKLDNYLKKKVTVTGMYSGSILYIDKIE